MSRILRSRSAAQTFEQPAKRVKTQESSPASAPTKKLEIGDAIPNVVLSDEDGNDVNLSEIPGLLVLFAYPKASTPGCTRQTKGFGSDYSEFEKLGAKVYGISADSEKAQSSFKTKLGLPFDLLSDPKYEVLAPLGAKKHPKGVIRSHWVFKDGKLVFAENGVKPDTSPELTLKAVIEAKEPNEPEEPKEPKEPEEPEEPKEAKEPEEETKPEGLIEDEKPEGLIEDQKPEGLIEDQKPEEPEEPSKEEPEKLEEKPEEVIDDKPAAETNPTENKPTEDKPEDVTSPIEST